METEMSTEYELEERGVMQNIALSGGISDQFTLLLELCTIALFYVSVILLALTMQRLFNSLYPYCSSFLASSLAPGLTSFIISTALLLWMARFGKGEEEMRD